MALLGSPWLIGLAGSLTGLLLFALLAVIEYGAWALVVPPRGRKAEENATEEGVPVAVIASDGVRLVGRFHEAEEGLRDGRVALLIHGFAESADAVQAERMETSRRAGWDVATIDQRGYGASGGLFASFGGREVGDVSAWLDALASRFGPDRPLTPVLWGRSMGAAVAVRAAALDPRIRGLILESPMVDLDEAMAVWFRRRRFPLPHVLARLVTRRASRLAGVSLTRPNALDAAPGVGCPALILHGQDDTLVPTARARQLAAAFPHPARFVEIPGAGHSDVVAIGGEALLAEVRSFLQEIGIGRVRSGRESG